MDFEKKSIVAPLTTVILSSMPEILDSRISDKLARSKVYECLLLNAWRRRRTDIEKCNGKLKVIEKTLLKSKEHQCTLESLIRFEVQRYKNMEQAHLSLQLKYENLRQKNAEVINRNETLNIELASQYDEVKNFKVTLEKQQEEIDEFTNIESKLATEIGGYKKAIEDMQKENITLQNEMQHLSREIKMKDDQYQEILISNNDLIQREIHYIQMVEFGNANLKMLEIDLEELRRLCHNHQIAIQERDAEVQQLHNVIKAAFSVRLFNLAKNCLLFTMASLYKVSCHMLPALPAPPEVLTEVDGPKYKQQSKPFGMIAPLLSVKTVSK